MYRFDLRVLAAGVIVLAVQVGTASLIELLGARPDLVLIFLLFLAYRYGSEVGLYAGLACGFALDITGTHWLGMYALLMSTLGFWAGKLIGRNAIVTRLRFWAILVAMSHLLVESLATAFLLYRTESSLISYIFRIVLPDTIYTTIIAVLAGMLALPYLKRQVHLNPERPKSNTPRNKPVIRE